MTLTPKTRTKTVAGTVLLTMAVAGTVLAGRASQERRTAAATAPSVAVGGLGEQRRWPLAFDVTLGQPGAAAPVRVRLTGQWMATAVAARADEVDIAHEIADVRLESDTVAAPRPEEVEALRARLSRRFWVTYRSDGAALQVHFPSDVGPTDRNLLQMIATGTQLVRPPAAGATWTALERDAAGTYLAAYQRDGAAITKRKVRYVEVDGATAPSGGGGLVVELRRSETRFSVDNAGAVRACDGADQLRIGLPLGEAGALEISAATHLGDVVVAAAPALVGGLAKAHVDTVPIRTHAPDPAQTQLEQDRRLLAGQTIDGLLAAAGTGANDRGLTARLAALFRREPSAVERAVALVRERGGLLTVTSALAASGGELALAALGSLARDAGAPDALRVEALTALMLTQKPTAAAMRDALSLFDAAGEVGAAARLVGGALASSGRAEHAPEAAALDEALLARWNGARLGPARARAALLGALGNSAGPSLVPAIEEGLHAPEVDVRSAAARALRLADGAPVDAALAAAMTSDRDPRVRSSAIFATQFRPFTPFVDALTVAATKDETVYVRAAAVKALRQHVDESPRILAILTDIAAHDPHASVRRVADPAARPDVAAVRP